MELSQILSYLIPVFSIAITFGFGILTQKFSERREIRLMRYETLYVPAMRELIEGYCWVASPGSHLHKYDHILRNIVMENTHLLGVGTARQIPDCLIAHNVVVMSDDYLRSQYPVDYEVPYSKDDIDFDETFTKFTLTLLLEAQVLSTKLKLPNLASTIYNLEK